MNDLAQVFTGLVRHHVVTQGNQTHQCARPGIDWLYAANGLFKRGSSPAIEIQARICAIAADVPGLCSLIPYIRWSDWPARLPGQLLSPLLADAQRASTSGTIAQPIEKQYFFVWRDGVRVVAPQNQEASAARVRYAMPQSGTVLLDLHSHHRMPAFFSSTDDHDDSGLSVSAVIGQIYTRPEIAVRLNIYGHHCPVPALMVFDSLGPFTDRFGERHADLTD
jgi:PRTRC genetic system protein A